jgi:hypothetical protein
MKFNKASAHLVDAEAAEWPGHEPRRVFCAVGSMPVLDRPLFALGLTLRPLCHQVVKPHDPV